MDTTETYIKMCDCPEIQGLAPDKHEAIIVFSLRNDITAYHASSVWANLDNNDAIWLPRQDQLQEMVYNPFPFSILASLMRFVFESESTRGLGTGLSGKLNPSYVHSFTSMEQLLLAFIMKEKFNKTWNGSGWE